MGCLKKQGGSTLYPKMGRKWGPKNSSGAVRPTRTSDGEHKKTKDKKGN